MQRWCAALLDGPGAAEIDRLRESLNGVDAMPYHMFINLLLVFVLGFGEIRTI